MKERPILFTGLMVRAILEGRKTQTRRVVKNLEGRPATSWTMHQAAGCADSWSSDSGWMGRCPYGQPGDRLWVREAWADSVSGNGVVYRADMTQHPKQRDPEVRAIFAQRCRTPEAAFKWKPSIHMPRSVSRILLEIVAVRVERLNDISEADAIAEGLHHDDEIPFNGPWFIGTAEPDGFAYPVDAYRELWQSINGPDAWAANPWVWVIEFKRVQP